MNFSKRNFIKNSFLASAAMSAHGVFAADGANRKTSTAPELNPGAVRKTHDPALVSEFVSVCHRDFERVKAMVAQEPKLVFSARDTGNVGIGDWESGLNAASHTGSRDIALFLLSQGARLDVFCAAMLGYRDVMLALLKADPKIATVKGPHNLNLLYHIAIGGEVAIAEAIKPLLPPDPREFNQSLAAAARDGRLEMTKWLLANGVTNVNAPDGFRRTPLKVAMEKKYEDVAAVLRANGGRETI
jgi:hypothetical protein